VDEKTKAEKRLIASKQAERFRSFDFKPSDFLARTKGDVLKPEGYVSLPGSIARTGLTVGGFISSQLRLDKVFPKQPVFDTSKATRIGSDILTFGAFAPAMVTTAQVETSIATLTKTLYTGVSKKVTKEGYLTRIGFYSQRGKKSEKGVVEVLSKVRTRGDKSLSISVFKGGTYENQILFPTAKIIKVPKRKFEGVDFSIIKSFKDKFKSVSVGKVKDKETVKFISAGVGETKKGVSKILGVTKTEVGDVVSFGKIKILPSTQKVTSITGKGVRTSPQDVVVTQAESIVKAVSVKPITTQVQPLPSLVSLTPTTKQEVITPTKQLSAFYGKGMYERTESYGVSQQVMGGKLDLQLSSSLRYDLVPLSKIKTDIGIKSQLGIMQDTKIKTKQKQKIAEQMKQPIKMKTQLRTKYALAHAQSTKTMLRMKTPRAFVFPRTTTPIKPPKTIISPLRLKKTKAQRQQKGFSVFVRRFGMFKPIGTGLSLKKAFEVGRTRTAKTLGVTFAVQGAGLKYKTPKGYYSKPSAKFGRLFLEKKKYRLSTGTEQREIKSFKRRTPIKRKKKKLWEI